MDSGRFDDLARHFSQFARRRNLLRGIVTGLTLTGFGVTRFDDVTARVKCGKRRKLCLGRCIRLKRCCGNGECRFGEECCKGKCIDIVNFCCPGKPCNDTRGCVCAKSKEGFTVCVIEAAVCKQCRSSANCGADQRCVRVRDCSNGVTATCKTLCPS